MENQTIRQAACCRPAALGLGWLILLFAPRVSAQDYVDHGNSRFNFAQFYVGVEGAYLPTAARTSYYDPDGNKRSYESPGAIEPRLSIGGLHFWGHADFYVSFQVWPMLGLGKSDDRVGASFTHGVDTGARYFPWRLEYGKVRPFAGLAFSAGQYKQNPTDEKETMSRFQVNRLLGSVGVAYQEKWGAITAEAQWAANGRVTVPVSATDKVTATTAPVSFQLGYRYVLDTTRVSQGYRDAQLGGRTASEREYVQWGESNRSSGLFLALGPSSAWTLSKFKYDSPGKKFLVERMQGGAIIPDAAFGYYFPAIEGDLRASYRYMYQHQHVLSLDQEIVRHVASLEASKALMDFHGFVPFVGAAVDLNFVTYREQYGNKESDDTATLPWFNLLAGWDIRPTKAATWLLRTNLRYNPGLRHNFSGAGGTTRVPLDQFEFNFIQFVWFPG